MFTIDMLRQLNNLSKPPEPFTAGEPLFWNDPHISKMMLEAHLDPAIEAASRLPETIEVTVKWLADYLSLEAGATWLDMGCGPGLYTTRLAHRGFVVTGIDYSQRSIAYAQNYASEHKLTIDYRYQNYLLLDDTAQYDVISLIYGDFCPLSPTNRVNLLERVHKALKPNGRFVFDVSTPTLRKRIHVAHHWYVALDGGFWKPGPHLVLERGFMYPNDIYLNQYIVIEADGTQTVYRNWFQDYTPQRLADEVTAQSFKIVAQWGDLTGAPYTDASDWLAVVAKRID